MSNSVYALNLIGENIDGADSAATLGPVVWEGILCVLVTNKDPLLQPYM